MKTYEAIVVGAGLSGAVVARSLAENLDLKVLVLEKRAHLAGNCYDYFDERDSYIQAYGPHLFHTDSSRVFNYLSRFTQFVSYEHRVQAYLSKKALNDCIDKHRSNPLSALKGLKELKEDLLMELPFNFNALEQLFEQAAAQLLEEKLLRIFGYDKRIPIFKLFSSKDQELIELAQLIFDLIFKSYTAKQWGVDPSLVDPQVLSRVPVLIGRDNRYFPDKYQALPAEGFTKMIESILDHHNIELVLNCDARERMRIHERQLYLDGAACDCALFYSGALDEFGAKTGGALEYRSVQFSYGEVEPAYKDSFLSHVFTTLNFPSSEAFTRISKLSLIDPLVLSGKKQSYDALFLREYPCPYEANEKDLEPLYPINDDKNRSLYESYRDALCSYPHFWPLGRLGTYRYLDMDDAVLAALDLFDSYCEQKKELTKA